MSAAPHPADFDPPPPQFCLSTLLWLVATAALVLAVARRLGPWTFLGAAWLGLLVLGHLAATAGGHGIYRRRRERAVPREAGPPSSPSLPAVPPPLALDLPPGHAAHRAAVVGATLGILAAVLAQAGEPWSARNLNGLIVTAASLGILGWLAGWALLLPLRLWRAGHPPPDRPIS